MRDIIDDLRMSNTTPILSRDRLPVKREWYASSHWVEPYPDNIYTPRQYLSRQIFNATATGVSFEPCHNVSKGLMDNVFLILRIRDRKYINSMGKKN